MSLHLENIKSYRDATVHFTPGINAICGLNGSGKTTLLEAIGFALFDHLPYAQAAFVREGEKFGTVRVRIQAADERLYDVVRRVGSSGLHYVADAETGEKLAERKENVLDWICTNGLNADAGLDLEALFRDAVGVPQGAMTAHFLAASTQRKGVFDPLLRVAEYRDAYLELRNTSSYIKDRQARQREEIARLEPSIAQIPEQESALRDLQGQALEVAALLARLQQEEAEALSGRDAMNDLRDRIAVAESQAQAASAVVAAGRAAVAQQEQQVGAAERAFEVVRRSEAGYRAVLGARRTLQDLEERRRERDKIDARLADAQADRKGIFGKIQTLDEQLQHAEACAAQAAAPELVARVEQQDRLGAELGDLRAQLGEVLQLQRQIAEAEREIAVLRQRVTSRDGQIARAREAGGQANDLPGLENRLSDTRQRLGSLGPIKQRRGEVEAEGRRLRLIHDRLKAEVEGREAALRQIEILGRDLGGVATLAERRQRLQEERVYVTATMEYQGVARVALAGHTCPLLELRCPVVSVDESVLQRFDDRVEGLCGRLGEIDTELADLGPALEVAEERAKRIRDLELEVARLEASVQQFDAVSGDLVRCREQYGALAAQLAEEQSLNAGLSDLEAQVRVAREAAALASQLAVLEEQQASDRGMVERYDTALSHAHGRLDALRAAEERSREIDRALQALNDPRTKQRELLAFAGRRPALLGEMEEAQVSLADAADRVKALLAELEAYASLQRDIEQQQEIVQRHQGDHDAYMKNVQEADALPKRRAGLVAAREDLTAAEEEEQALRTNLSTLAAAYDARQHGLLELRCADLGKQIAAEKQRAAHVAADAAKVEQNLARLRRQQEQMQRVQVELSRIEETGRAVDFIRTTINEAGPAITETILRNISLTANDIFADIMDDHAAELRWDRDYEVLVQRGAETRKFAQLSGGEQMSAALAIRLALLREMSDVDFAFFDEPTQNMDLDRRENLAQQIRGVKGFDQLVVISHDDTFEHHTDNLIRLRKVYEETQVEAG